MVSTVEGLSWRRWLFQAYHETLLHAHRPFTETHQLVRRTGFWEGLASDVAEWCGQCPVCTRYRSRAVLPPMRSILADDQMLEALPWSDVIVDVQGPYTRAEAGEQYVLSYHCTWLKVPKLEAFKALAAGSFGRALAACVFTARAIPDVVRTDRGPEMRS